MTSKPTRSPSWCILSEIPRALSFDGAGMAVSAILWISEVMRGQTLLDWLGSSRTVQRSFASLAFGSTVRTVSSMIRVIGFEERNHRRGIGPLGFGVSATVATGSQLGRWVSEGEYSIQRIDLPSSPSFCLTSLRRRTARAVEVLFIPPVLVGVGFGESERLSGDLVLLKE